jgi:hypothetical protein
LVLAVSVADQTAMERRVVNGKFLVTMVKTLFLIR